MKKTLLTQPKCNIKTRNPFFISMRFETIRLKNAIGKLLLILLFFFGVNFSAKGQITGEAHNETDLRTLIANTPANGWAVITVIDAKLTEPTPIIIDNGKTIELIGHNPSMITQTVHEVRHFDISDDAALILRMIILEGWSRGGGISNSSGAASLTLGKGAQIRNCLSEYSSGGAISFVHPQSWIIIESGALIHECYAMHGSAIGGGIYCAGRVEMRGGAITKNFASSGGGIFMSGGVLEMSGGVISNNTARGGAGIWNGNGYNESGGGGIYLHGGTLTMSGNATITGNKAESTTHNVIGGGIFADGPNSKISLQGDIAITNNRVSRSNNQASGNGGGIYLGTTFTSLTTSGLNTLNINGNTASGSGGGIYSNVPLNLSATSNAQITIAHNTAGIEGGGVYFINPLSFTAGSNVVFRGNRAQGAYLLNSAHVGNYLGVTHTAILAHCTAGNVAPTSISLKTPFQYAYNNYDVNYVGGSTATQCPIPDWERLRTAVANPIVQTITIYKDDAMVSENLNTANAILKLCENHNFINSDKTHISIIRPLTIRSASANTSDIITLFMPENTNVSSRHFLIENLGHLTLENIILDGNSNGGGIFSQFTSSFPRPNVTLTLESGAVIQNCLAVGLYGGGAIEFPYSGSTINIKPGSLIHNNAAMEYLDMMLTGSGGGIRCGGTINMTGGKISSNKATGYGGGIYGSGNSNNSEFTFNMTGGIISGNTAGYGNIDGNVNNEFFEHPYSTGEGGGVCTFYGTITLSGSGTKVQGNYGAGISSGRANVTIVNGATVGGAEHFPQFNIDNKIGVDGDFGNYSDGIRTGGTSYISGNIIGNGGRGISSVSDNTCTIAEGAFISNNNDGGVLVSGGILNITGGTISNNSAIEGGGVYIRYRNLPPVPAFFHQSGGIISNNKASRDGGGIFSDGCSITLSGNATITGNISGSNQGAVQGRGGGVYIRNPFPNNLNPKFHLQGNIVITNNSAFGNFSYGSEYFGRGGGILLGGHFDGVIEFSTSGLISLNLSGNTTPGFGGGIYSYSPLDFSASPSAQINISNNTAGIEGGAIYLTNPLNLIAGSNVTFSGNSAPVAHLLSASYSDNYLGATHAAILARCTGGQVAPASISLNAPFQYAYNNHDVNYVGGQPYYVNPDSDWERLRLAVSTPIVQTVTIYRQDALVIENLNTTNAILKLQENLNFINSNGLPIDIAQTVTIQSANANDTIRLYTPGSVNENKRHFTMSSTGNLTLENLMLNGNDNGGGISSTANVTLTLNSGAVIRNCRSLTDNHGGGINFKHNLSTINIKPGALISNNTTPGDWSFGGGIYSEGMIEMDGGTITGNIGANGGGVYCKGTFVMRGGTISENVADPGPSPSPQPHKNGGGVYNEGIFTMISGNISNNTSGYAGGGVMNTAEFKMTGGTISNNTSGSGASGVNNMNGVNPIFIMEGGTISRNLSNGDSYHASAVFNSITSTFIMRSGTIYGNTDLLGTRGIGVWNLNNFTMEGGEISNNYLGIRNTRHFTMSGGKISNNRRQGVESQQPDATFIMEDGEIINNNASGVRNYYGLFTMNGGKISGNNGFGNPKAEGGGVYNAYGGTVTINGGEISYNTALDGGGIYSDGTSGGDIHFSPIVISTVTINGGVIVHNTATRNGGGLFTEEHATVTVHNGGTNNVIFQNNTAATKTPWLTTNNKWGAVNTVYQTQCGTFVPSTANISALPGETLLGASATYDNLYNNYDINLEIKTLTYHANFGIMSDTETYYYISGSMGTVLPGMFTRHGYNFVEWNTKPSGTGTAYNPNSSVTVNDNTTLYAQWTLLPGFYEVELWNCPPNVGGGGNVYERTIAVEYGEPMPSGVPPSVIKPAQYGSFPGVFLGYGTLDPYSNNYGGTWKIYYNGEMESVRNWDIPKDTALYGIWNNTAFDLVMYHANGGTFDDDLSPFYQGDLYYVMHTNTNTYILPPTAVTRNGYLLTGWSFNASGGAGSEVTELTPYDNTKPKVVYAQWAPKITVTGTVFPFVYQEGENGFNALFPITVSLKPIPNNLLSPTVYEDLLAETPLFSENAIYYDGTLFVEGTPKSPGALGEFNNFGLPINFMDALGGGIVHGASASPTLLNLEKPDNNEGATVGVFTLEVIPGDYILEIKRDGYMVRWAKITIDAQEPTVHLGHRELIPGDVKTMLRIDSDNAQQLLSMIEQGLHHTHTDYEPHLDLNADGYIDIHDYYLLQKYIGFRFYHYEETMDWLNE